MDEGESKLQLIFTENNGTGYYFKNTDNQLNVKVHSIVMSSFFQVTNLSRWMFSWEKLLRDFCFDATYLPLEFRDQVNQTCVFNNLKSQGEKVLEPSRWSFVDVACTYDTIINNWTWVEIEWDDASRWQMVKLIKHQTSIVKVTNAA